MDFEEVNVKTEDIVIEYDELTASSNKDEKKEEYTVEQKIVTATWWHEKDHNQQTLADINKNFRLRFPGHDVPDVKLIMKWEHLLFTSGEISDVCEINLEEVGSDEESLSDNADLES